LKFRATRWALKRIVFFAYHFHSATEPDKHLVLWAAVVCRLNTTVRVFVFFVVLLCDEA
jgi:hypothetical protein